MKSLRSLTLLVLVLLMMPGTIRAQSQEPVAVITELKFNRGEIQLRTSSGKSPERPAVLQSLYPGNVVQTTKDAVAVILFTDGARTVTVDEKSSSFEVKALAAKDNQSGARVKEVASLLLGKKKPPTYVALAVRGKAQPPTLLSPRNTKLMSDTPTFQWMGMDQQPGTVKVFSPEGMIWSAENINLTKIAYPASAPRLVPDVEYSWAIEKKGFAASKAPFKLMRQADVQMVREKIAELRSAPGLTKTTLAVLKSNFLMSRELFYEAREILLEEMRADPDEPTLHFVLGELYEKIGIKNLAADEYGEAEFLSKTKP